jgi:hypothetical protein
MTSRINEGLRKNSRSLSKVIEGLRINNPPRKRRNDLLECPPTMVNHLLDPQSPPLKEFDTIIKVKDRVSNKVKTKIEVRMSIMTMISMIITRTEVELQDQVRLRTIKPPCLSIWANDEMNPIKTFLKGRKVNQTISEPTITPSKIMVFPKLKRILLFRLEVKIKVKSDLKEVDDPDKIKIQVKYKKTYSKSKDKVQNDERMRPQPLRKLKWTKHKKKEMMFLNSMLFQRYPLPYFV